MERITPNKEEREMIEAREGLHERIRLTGEAIAHLETHPTEDAKKDAETMFTLCSNFLGLTKGMRGEAIAEGRNRAFAKIRQLIKSGNLPKNIQDLAEAIVNP